MGSALDLVECPWLTPLSHASQILTLLFVTYTVYWAAREPQARGAAQVGLLALGAEWVAEVPSLVFKYFFCATVCPCCMPKKDSVNSVSDIVGGAPSCHIDMERTKGAVGQVYHGRQTHAVAVAPSPRPISCCSVAMSPKWVSGS
eukprot:scaffold165692_cov37-Tisochrysis_lutea.AAC.2